MVFIRLLSARRRLPLTWSIMGSLRFAALLAPRPTPRREHDEHHGFRHAQRARIGHAGLFVGTTRTGLLPGNYLIECKPVVGQATPLPATALVQTDQTVVPTITYFLAHAQTGTPPSLVPFEMVNTSQNLPYAYAGQVRSDIGSSSGFTAPSDPPPIGWRSR